MKRLALVLAFLLTTALWAQDSDDGDTSATEGETETVEGLSEEELEDLDIDSQTDHTEEDDDVFKPTDVVSYQQSVNFPVDI